MTHKSLIRNLLATGDGTNDDERLPPGGDGLGKWRIRRLVGEILFAGEEAEESATLERRVLADRPAQHGVPGFERVEDGALRDGGRDVEFDLGADLR